jgi:hypothetical protein
VYDIDVACLQLLQAGLDTDEHRLCVVAGIVTFNSLRIRGGVVVRGELHY